MRPDSAPPKPTNAYSEGLVQTN
ncbi:hypothetical protein BOSE21B_110549 [Bosea sp. 21B]|nr:hypothetical protein BOSE21B_110549 [Bosea sp. 21B]